MGVSKYRSLWRGGLSLSKGGPKRGDGRGRLREVLAPARVVELGELGGIVAEVAA